MHRITRLRAAGAAAALTALLGVGAVAVAAIPDSTGAINACYGSNGKLRAVDAPGDCGGSETSIALGGPTYGYAFSNADFATIAETTTVVGSLAPGGQLPRAREARPPRKLDHAGVVRRAQPPSRGNDDELGQRLEHRRARCPGTAAERERGDADVDQAPGRGNDAHDVHPPGR